MYKIQGSVTLTHLVPRLNLNLNHDVAVAVNQPSKCGVNGHLVTSTDE